MLAILLVSGFNTSEPAGSKLRWPLTAERVHSHTAGHQQITLIAADSSERCQHPL